MNIEIINQENNLVEMRIDNLTVAELLRVYLNENGIKFAAWRRDHLTKPAIFRIEASGKTVKKAVAEAIGAINKDLDAFSKLK